MGEVFRETNQLFMIFIETDMKSKLNRTIPAKIFKLFMIELKASCYSPGREWTALCGEEKTTKRWDSISVYH